MELIQNNPYRIAGILSNATERELQKRQTKIKAYSRVGKEIESEFDFNILNTIKRTEDSISKAFSNIEQNQDKINNALFWFLNANPFDSAALEYLKNGNADKAVEIWEKVTLNKDVNSKNFSAFNNIGTYKLLSSNQKEVKEGIEAKIKLIESDYFESFVHSVADETFTIDKQKQVETLIDELLILFKNQYSSSETLQLFSGCNGTTQKYISQKSTEEPLHNIESQIENCKNKRKNSNIKAYQLGLNLASNSKSDLTILQSLLGTTDLKYKTIADQLANEIMQCGIDYFNESQENDSRDDYLEQSKKLNQLALSIAAGSLVRDRAKDHIATLEEMKDRELNQAIDVLKSIKDAYDNNAAQLMRQVKEQEATMGYNQSINWSKVTELIKNSIDWDKAIELILNIIPREHIIKIKNTKNSIKVNEYKELVEFLLNKLSYSRKSKIQYLQYWQVTKTSSSTTKSTSNTRTNNHHQTTESEFSFSENAWWILGAVGVVAGLMMGFGWVSIVPGVIGIVIGYEFKD